MHTPAIPGTARIAVAAIVAAALLALGCISAPRADANYGDGFGAAPAEGAALPAGSAWWAGTCDLAAAPAPGDPIDGGVGARPLTTVSDAGVPPLYPATTGPTPAVPPSCIDPGVANNGLTASPWVTPPAWRLPAVTQAGAHPDATASFALTRDTTQTFAGYPDGNLKRVSVDLPPGLTGNPTAVTRCTAAQFAARPIACPASSQVGVLQVTLNVITSDQTHMWPVYSIEPRPGMTAEFGAGIALGPTASPIRLVASARTGTDDGLTVTISRTPTGLPLMSSTMTFWGVPWAASHDLYRGHSLASEATLAYETPVLGLAPTEQVHYDPSWGPIKPFLSNPTSCSAVPPVTGLRITSWQAPDVEKAYTAPAPPVMGCGQVPFGGSLSVVPDSTLAGVPAGYAFDLSVPQSSDPDVLASGHLKRAVVVLPVGVRVNPSSADGLQGCTLEQANLHSEADSSCPDGSKIGSLTIETPLLSDPLRGDVYLAQPHANPFDSLLSIYLVARGPGLVIKLPGRIDPDPVTGQLTAVFDENPQLPFSRLHLQFDGGARAPLSNPPTCGVKTTHTTLMSWSGKSVSSDSSFTVTGCEPGRFSPMLDAGTTDPLAGAFSPFTLSVSRTDADQEFDSLHVHMPPGLLGMIGSVPLCAEAQMAAGTCEAASRVGSTTVGAGAGPTPLYLKGDVYVGGPYEGAPFSLSIVVDTKGQAGPFDLGKVVVRAPIDVDAANAKLDVTSDPLPRILQGIPLQIRYINVTLDRPSFTFNATSCTPEPIAVQLTSTEGATSYPWVRYQPTGCDNLPFAPRMTAQTTGTTAFKQGAELHVGITQRSGEAGIRSVSVLLPKQLPSRLIPTINNACTIAQFEADYTRCPADSYIGTSSATTPVFPEPLSGPVYVVARPNDVPKIAVLLFGHGIATGVDLELDGDIIVDAGGGRSKSTFHMVPDVPITAFRLDLPSGPHSILDAPSDDLCRGPLSMDVTEIAQSGARIDTKVPVAVSDCPTVGTMRITRRVRYQSGIGGGYVKVSVKAPSAGRFTVTGRGIWPASRRVVRKGGFVLKARATDALRAQLRRRPRTVAVKVAFQPGNAPKGSAATSRATIRAGRG